MGCCLLYSNAPAVWEADLTGLSPTQKFLSPDPKQAPFYEYQVLRPGTHIESGGCGGYKKQQTKHFKKFC